MPSDILKAYARVDQRRLEQVGELNLAPKVMAEIMAGKRVMKPLWLVQLKKALAGSSALGLTILAILALNFSLFMMDRHGALELINFGPYGIPAIASSLPYDFLALAAMAALAGYAFLRHFNLTIHHSHLRLAALYSMFVVSLAMSFSFTGLNAAALALNPSGRSIVDKIIAHYAARFQYNLDENQAIIGRVVKSLPEEILVETPLKTVIRLQEPPANNYLKQPFITEGQIIKALGWREGDVFHVSVADAVGLNGANFFNGQSVPAIQLIPLP